MAPEKQLTGTGCIVKPQVSLANLTSFKVGGPAEWFATPRSTSELQACVQWANSEGLPITRLGAGSNLLISDRGLPGLVICTRYLRHSEFDQTGRVTAAAGMPMATLAWKAAKRGWRGLVWTIGIPGTVGGAVVMNAGAHGSDTRSILVEVEVLNPDGSFDTLMPEQLQFQYRTSVLQSDFRIVTQASFQLQPGYDPRVVRAETSADLEQRRTTQPYHLPSCGSVFRNPNPKSAGWLIEQSGLKGFKVGQAQVAERHANFILNCGGATASDIFQLIRYIQNIVDDKWSLRLRPEVQILGDFQTA
ncbi:MAG: UDP-N-acetylmuramate dehydrogenase [Symploca sp. SIO2G7]|nr:UDP-N-acetylmuramate dehydrogenase [Symploca sp. SIO2G7]